MQKKRKLYIILTHYVCITMAMAVTQVRLPEGLEKEIGILVESGFYANKSDAIRDAVRRLVLEKMIGIIPNTGDSIKEIREIRKKLSKKIKSYKDIEEINKLVD